MSFAWQVELGDSLSSTGIAIANRASGGFDMKSNNLRNKIGRIQAAVERCYMGHVFAPRERKVQVINMEVNDVETMFPAEQLFQHYDVVSQLVDAALTQPQRLWTYWHKMSAGNGIAAREKRHIVSKANQFLGKIGHHSFRPAIKFRGNTFHKRRNLGNSHSAFLSQG